MIISSAKPSGEQNDVPLNLRPVTSREKMEKDKGENSAKKHLKIMLAENDAHLKNTYFDHS